jgi:hypothetical protein
VRNSGTVRGFATHNMIVHHADVANGVATCGRTEIQKPTTADWRMVDCPDCVSRRPPRLRLVATEGACEVCRRVDGRDLSTPPDEPYRVGIRGCTHPGGCRCRVVSA